MARQTHKNLQPFRNKLNSETICPENVANAEKRQKHNYKVKYKASLCKGKAKGSQILGT